MALFDSAARAPRQQEPARRAGAHFHLPDLCSVGALLPLILVGQLLAITITLAISRLPDFDWPIFSLLSAEILWIVLIGAFVLCRLRPRLQNMTAATGAALCYGALIAVIAAVVGAGQGLLSYISLSSVGGWWTTLQHVAVGAILAGLTLRYFFLQQQLHLQEQAQLAATMQARFQSLQSRIRPHFLFNSMNIIASLIDTDPATAERVVEDMSALFRASLSDAEDLVPLSQEITLCERYINIEQLRLGERLQVQWEKSLRSEQYPVPSLCLQPLIENAIYHGVQPLVQGGTITIALSDTDSQLQCTISNPWRQDTANARRGNGMALDNLEQRLRARYGSRTVFIVQRDADRFTVHFSLPLDSAPTRQGGT